jgi:medium-chain acyl-[acyl-carrier-protein] hydrolase
MSGGSGVLASVPIPAGGAPWLLRPQAGSPSVARLFCFPFAGGGAASYVQWARGLPAGLELCAVQLPGRESRLGEPARVQFFPLINELADALAPWLIPPFAFFGHSMGALLAFELARELRRRERPLPERLLLSGRQAPTQVDDAEPMHQLDDPEFVARLSERYDGIPDAVRNDADFLRLFLPTMRADFELLTTYVYRPELPLPCPFSIYCGRHDPQVRGEALQDWRWQTTGGFEIRWLEGGHFYYQPDRKPLLGALAEDLRPLIT